jgi:hypothetical protein
MENDLLYYGNARHSLIWVNFLPNQMILGVFRVDGFYVSESGFIRLNFRFDFVPILMW